MTGLITEDNGEYYLVAGIGVDGVILEHDTPLTTKLGKELACKQTFTRTELQKLEGLLFNDLREKYPIIEPDTPMSEVSPDILKAVKQYPTNTDGSVMYTSLPMKTRSGATYYRSQKLIPDIIPQSL